MVYQFAWTLRQDERVTTFSITIGDQPVTMEGGTSQFSVELGSEYAPYDVQASSLLFRLRGGLLESGDSLDQCPRRRPARPGPVRRRAGVGQPHRPAWRRRSRAAARRSRSARSTTRHTGDRRCSAGPDLLRRRGTSPTAVVGGPGGRRRPGQRDRPSRAEDRAIADVPGISGTESTHLHGLPRRHPARGRRRGKHGDRSRISRIRYDGRGPASRGDPVADLPWSARGHPDDPRHRLAVGDHDRGALPSSPGTPPRSPVPVDGLAGRPARRKPLDEAPKVSSPVAANEPLYAVTRSSPPRPHRFRGRDAPAARTVTRIDYAG